jgi:hypothetical protein
MATVNLGSIKFKWKGTYSGATAYTIDDVVEYNGSSYICILASTGNLPTDATYFEQMSSAGTNGSNGTDLTTTLTTQGDLVYRDGSGLARLGAGTAGQALVTGGAGANPSWSTVSSDFVKISSGTLSSGTAKWSIDGHFSSTYKDYKLYIRQLATGNNGATMYARMNIGGSEYSSGDYSWSQNNHYSTSHSQTGNNNASEFRIHQNSNNLTHPSVEEFLIFDPLSTSKRTSILYRGHGFDGLSNATNGSVGGAHLRINSAISGITIYSDGGADVLAGAEYLIYGLKG